MALVIANLTLENLTVDVPIPLDANYLVVAGGGGGGSMLASDPGGAGGGGAGGLLIDSAVLKYGVTYTITIGAGGAGRTQNSGIQGQNTILSGGALAVTAYGGGFGGGGYKYYADSGGNGGSGGGAGARDSAGMVGGYAVYPGSPYISGPRQGYDGSTSTGFFSLQGGGGGGAGEPRVRTVANVNGANGVYSFITGANVAYAGGGGGQSPDPGVYGTPTVSGTGGAGGGGAGGGNNGASNTGGGGGGKGTTTGKGGNGGSGVVIIQMLEAVPLATTTGSPTITTSGGFRIYQFTGSGSITFN